MKFLKIIRDEEFIQLRFVTDDGILAREEQEITSHEAPLKEFDEALQALAPIACNILEVGKAYDEGMNVRSVRIKRTKKGTRSVSIGVEKTLSAVDNPHRLATPFFTIDAPSEGEQGARECSSKQTEVIDAFIAQAEKYQNGERQQRLLPLGAEPEEGDELPGNENT